MGHDILRAFAQGEPSACRTVTGWCWKVANCARYGLTHEEKQDVIGEATVALLANLQDPQFVADTPQAYVSQVARFKALNVFRAKRKWRFVPTEELSKLMREYGREWTARLEVEDLVRRIGPVCQEIFDLRYAERLRFKDIAERYGISENAAKSRHWRCMEELRSLWNGDSAN